MLVAAAICFILPAALIVPGCGWGKVRYGSLPEFAAILYGVKPVIIAIVLRALWDPGRTAIKTQSPAAICFAGLNELAILLLAGIGAGLARWAIPPRRTSPREWFGNSRIEELKAWRRGEVHRTKCSRL